MNTRIEQTSTSAALPPSTTEVAESEGWLASKGKELAPTFFIAVFLVLPLALPGLVFAAPPAAEQAGVIQTQEANDEGVVGELIVCRRSEGVLTIKVRFRNNSDKAVTLTFIHWGSVGLDVPKFYVTAGNKKYFVLKDTDGTVLSSNSSNSDASLAPGKTFLWWGKYPAPPADVKKINFMMPITTPFEDVPISDK